MSDSPALFCALPGLEPPVAGGVRSLFAFFRRHRAAGTPLVLATVVATTGTTYRKPGAQMLIRDDTTWQGLLSGGCLEGDLAEHARAVLRDGRARCVDYDLSAMNDTVWGFGLGCDGGVRILLQRLDAAAGWEPFASIVAGVEQGIPGRLVLPLDEAAAHSLPAAWALVRPDTPPLGPLAGLPMAAAADWTTVATIDCEWQGGRHRCVSLPLPALPRLVLLGGGPDAGPLTQFAAQLGWHVTVVDHRPAFADPVRLPAADRVVLAAGQVLPDDVDLSRADAVVIMSHNLAADERYLAAAVRAAPRYLGLLGPAARRQKLLATLPAAAATDDIRGPVGLDLGGEGPEAVALSIVAEIQAHLHGKRAIVRRG